MDADRFVIDVAGVKLFCYRCFDHSNGSGEVKVCPDSVGRVVVWHWRGRLEDCEQHLIAWVDEQRKSAVQQSCAHGS